MAAIIDNSAPIPTQIIWLSPQSITIFLLERQAVITPVMMLPTYRQIGLL